MNLRLLLFSVLVALVFTSAKAQIPNGGFEDWTSNGLWEDPTGWTTTNYDCYGAGVPVACQKVDPGAVGDHCAHLTNEPLALNPAAGSISRSFPFTSRPTALTAQWFYSIQPGDSGNVSVIFTKWNSTTNSADHVGGCDFVFGGQVPGSWQAMNIPLGYDLSIDPDTAYVLVTSSIYPWLFGSFIQIDALDFSYQTGIADLHAGKPFQLFPSPASDVIQVDAESPLNEVEIFSLDGRFLAHHDVHASHATVDVADLSPGRYLIHLRWEDGSRGVRMFMKM